MEKINVAELLKDCPKGMELDCTMIDNVVFEKLDFISSHHPIIIRRTDSNKTIHLTKYGQYSDEEDYKCVIFPKGKTTWEGFAPSCQFKDGDIVSTMDGIWIGIVKRPVSGACETYVTIYSDSLVYNDNIFCFERFATEEEKAKLFQAIKDNGYKWNPKTKTLEKLIEPKFKVGDKVKSKLNSDTYTIKEVSDTQYVIVETVYKYRYIEDIEAQVHWELLPNKFDINTLKPFDKVLVRLTKDGVWNATFFSHYDKEVKWGCYPFVTTSSKSYLMCIPYEQNKHLVGKSDDCDEFYKTW